MQQKIVITGGTGTIGKALTHKLLMNGYKVAHLSRKIRPDAQVETFLWDPAKKYIQEGAFDSVHSIIHLAGSGIFDHSWTSAYKQEIIDSRVKTAELLLEKLQQLGVKPESFLSSSGIAIYGSDTEDKAITETSPVQQGFLSQVVQLWEKAADEFQNAGIRTVKFRTGIVFAKDGGALVQLLGTMRFGLGAPLGSGNQFIPWIHIEDVCDMYLFALNNTKTRGVYNAVSPFPISNKEFTKTAAEVLNKPLWLPAVPGFVLKTILGKDKSDYILGGNRIVSPKIEEQGFKFRYPILKSALHNLLIE